MFNNVKHTLVDMVTLFFVVGYAKFISTGKSSGKRILSLILKWQALLFMRRRRRIRRREMWSSGDRKKIRRVGGNDCLTVICKCGWEDSSLRRNTKSNYKPLQCKTCCSFINVVIDGKLLYCKWNNTPDRALNGKGNNALPGHQDVTSIKVLISVEKLSYPYSE